MATRKQPSPEDIETMQGALWAIRLLLKHAKPNAPWGPEYGIGILLTQQRLRETLTRAGAETDQPAPPTPPPVSLGPWRSTARNHRGVPGPGPEWDE